jgi:hypothetical protein
MHAGALFAGRVAEVSRFPCRATASTHAAAFALATYGNGNRQGSWGLCRGGPGPPSAFFCLHPDRGLTQLRAL